LVLVLLLSGCFSRPEAAIIIAGSTSVQPYAELLVEGFAVQHPEFEIDVQGGGSSAGITAADTGTADIGMSSRALKDTEQHLWVVKIAKDGLAVIIHPQNPLHNLTLQQVRDVYTGVVTNWSEVGGRDAKIHIIAREEGSGTRSAFEELVMDENHLISPKAIVQNSNGAVRMLVGDDINAIGFISLGLVDDTVKALSLDGIEASRENILGGSYSLFRPFLFVSNGQPDEHIMEFIDYILSPEGQQILSTEGLIPE